MSLRVVFYNPPSSRSRKPVVPMSLLAVGAVLEGEFDYVTYLKSMQAHGYDGVISVEISTMVQRRPDYDPLATATRAYQVLSQAFARAGIQ